MRDAMGHPALFQASTIKTITRKGKKKENKKGGKN